jgi:hypothetical protein
VLALTDAIAGVLAVVDWSSKDSVVIVCVAIVALGADSALKYLDKKLL